MLVIRKAQIQALGKHVQADFQERVVRLLAENYPRECRQAGGRPQIDMFVQLGVEKAAARGFRNHREVVLFVTLMMILGLGFEHDPQLPWVADLLDEAVISDPTVRIVTYCEVGKISTLAAATLRRMGFTRVLALDGGMKAWREKGFPVEGAPQA